MMNKYIHPSTIRHTNLKSPPPPAIYDTLGWPVWRHEMRCWWFQKLSMIKWKYWIRPYILSIHDLIHLSVSILQWLIAPFNSMTEEISIDDNAAKSHKVFICLLLPFNQFYHWSIDIPFFFKCLCTKKHLHCTSI